MSIDRANVSYEYLLVVDGSIAFLACKAEI